MEVGSLSVEKCGKDPGGPPVIGTTGPFGFAARNWSHPHEVPTNPHTSSPFRLYWLWLCRVTDAAGAAHVTVAAPTLLRPGRSHVVGGPVHIRRATSPRSPIPERPTCPRQRTAFWPWPAPTPTRAPAKSALSYMESNVDAYVSQDGADGPGQLALLILDAHALGVDPTSFGGTDLVARLMATEETSGSNDGLFGTKPQVNDFQAGVFDQGLALAALAATGDTKGSAIRRRVVVAPPAVR